MYTTCYNDSYGFELLTGRFQMWLLLSKTPLNDIQEVLRDTFSTRKLTQPMI